ncbi:MAG: hypothetical protein ACLRP3_02965 [Escherichia sp.]
MRCFLALPTDRRNAATGSVFWPYSGESDVVSPLDVPGFDNSAMDGYAVRLADIASRQRARCR